MFDSFDIKYTDGLEFCLLYTSLVITFSISASGRDTFHEIASINSFLFVLNKKELY